jgi:hypothetical protein
LSAKPCNAQLSCHPGDGWFLKRNEKAQMHHHPMEENKTRISTFKLKKKQESIDG